MSCKTYMNYKPRFLQNFSIISKYIVIVFFLIFLSISSTYAIEVGGHITEDTTWSPENSPYQVTETVIVDEGVILTILPGTEVKICGATCTSWQEFDTNFWLYGGVSVAKFIQVEGRIIAEGTEQDSIVFTRLQDNPDYCWGTIYITQEAELCRFTHCRFEYSAGIGLALSNLAEAAISIYNGKGIIHDCLFLNNGASVATFHSYVKNVEIIRNTFTFDNNMIDFLINLWICDLGIIKNEENYQPVLIAYNEFYSCYVKCQNAYFSHNAMNDSDYNIGSLSDKSYVYDNIFTDSWKAVSGGYDYDSIYVKNNQFIGGTYGIYVDYAYVEVVDNYFEGCRLTVNHSGSSKLINNIIANNPEPILNPAISGNVDIITQNVINNCGAGISGSAETQFSNNIFVNNNSVCSSLSDRSIIENEIIIYNDRIFTHIPSVHGNPIVRNCIIDFELPDGCIDGGGNIIVDSLQAQQIFEDIENGDFHLAEASIAIDAGFDTLGYYCPFDIEYHTRVWDGNGDRNAIIDIGAYEYGAPSSGGIQGYTYNPISGERVDYVFIKINNEPGEFTFSDSAGNFEYKLSEGMYDIYAERVFYDDVIEYNIEVIDGEFTQLALPMTETFDVDEPEQEHGENDLFISAYPNPFSTSTTLQFNKTSEITENTEVKIYNIKGQLVRELRIFTSSLPRFHEATWDGKDENGIEVGTGVYFYKLSGNNEQIGKVVKLK